MANLTSVTGRTALNVHDIPNAGLGDVTMKYGDGTIINGMHTIDLEVNVEYEKEDKAVLGLTHKESIKLGSSGTFSGTFYDVTSQFRKIAEKYQNEGVDYLFDMTVTQMDPNTKAHLGYQKVTYYDCSLDSLTISKLDIGATDLEVEMEGTFSYFRIENSYNDLPGIDDTNSDY